MPATKRLLLILVSIMLAACVLPKNSKTVSDLKSDETLVFFNTYARYNEERQAWDIPVHGWVYEPVNSRFRSGVFQKILNQVYDLNRDEENAVYFDERVNLLLADNERNKHIVISLGDKRYELPPSKPNGHFKGLISVQRKEANQLFDEKGFLEFKAALPKGDSRSFPGQVRLLENVGVSVISDIDDTVKITGVTDKRQLFESTFFKPFSVVKGMPALYNQLASRDVSIHFVSSSPWQLYGPLSAMLEQHDFPWASFSLKKFRFKDKTLFNLFKKGTKTKPAKIEKIIKRYPHRKFLLIGDSGEQDPEVYTEIYHHFPDQVMGIYIREMQDDPSLKSRIAQLNSTMDHVKIYTFKHPGELDIEKMLLPANESVYKMVKEVDSGF